MLLYVVEDRTKHSTVLHKLLSMYVVGNSVCEWFFLVFALVFTGIMWFLSSIIRCRSRRAHVSLGAASRNLCHRGNHFAFFIRALDARPCLSLLMCFRSAGQKILFARFFDGFFPLISFLSIFRFSFGGCMATGSPFVSWRQSVSFDSDLAIFPAVFIHLLYFLAWYRTTSSRENIFNMLSTEISFVNCFPIKTWSNKTRITHNNNSLLHARSFLSF